MAAFVTASKMSGRSLQKIPVLFSAGSRVFQVFDADVKRNVRFTGTLTPRQTNERWAIDLIKEVPPKPVKARIVACDSGPSLLGHPRVYINLDENDGGDGCRGFRHVLGYKGKDNSFNKALGVGGGDWDCSKYQFSNFAPGEGGADNVNSGGFRGGHGSTGGMGGRDEDSRPGEWECSECQFTNFAFRKTCFKCEAPGGSIEDRETQPFSSRPGDWECSECHFTNFAFRNTCFKCEAPGGGAAADVGGSNSGGFRGGRGSREGREDRETQPYSSKPGDWECSECHFSNFAFRKTCFKCEAPGGSIEGREDRETQPYSSKPGNWECSKCHFSNFVFRKTCFKCEAPGGSIEGREDRETQPSSSRPGDWECSECHFRNFAFRNTCFKCKAPGGGGTEGGHGEDSRGRGGGNFDD